MKMQRSEWTKWLWVGFLLAGAQPGFGAVALSGDVSDTAISGFKGTPFTVGNASSTTQAVFGLSSKERSDNPCLVTVLTESVANSAQDGSAKKDLCGKSATSSELFVDFGDSDATGKSTFVTGVRVCMNNDKSRVKGFQIRGKQISSAGDTGAIDEGDDECSEVFDPKKGPLPQQGGIEYRLCGGVNAEPRDTRTNCDDQDGWMKWVECPAGKVATAAILHFGAGKEPRSLTGIALKCRTVSLAD